MRADLLPARYQCCALNAVTSMQLIGKVRTGKSALASIPLCALEAPLLAPHLLHGLGAHSLPPLHGARLRLVVLLFRLIFLHVA